MCHASLDNPGGVIFVDDAHRMTFSNRVIDYMARKIDKLQGKVVFVFAGSSEEMESFLGERPVLPSLIPRTLKFDDYDDSELHQIFTQLIKDRFDSKMRVEEGLKGLYMRIIIRRLGRARGNASFSNARAVQNIVSQILGRQAARLTGRRKANEEADDFYLTKIDLIGPPPSKALEGSKAWKKLQGKVGLASVKESLKALVDRLQVNYERELAEQPLVECSLNKVFLGNPGTGKTTVAKLYARILADIGLLSSGEVLVKTPSDFIGKYIGDSEANTKSILRAAMGKVLVIDEFYALSPKAKGSNADCFKQSVIDTLVSEVQGTAIEDRCVLLLGYKENMEEMWQIANPGLTRRFPLVSAFEFQDYSDEDLRQILDLQLVEQGFSASDQAKEVAMEAIRRTRNRKNFGNASEVEILLDRAKGLQQKRLSSKPGQDPLQLLPQDIDPDFDRVDREPSISKLFEGFVGAENLVEKLEGYKRIVQNCKIFNMDPATQVPFNFLFKGPPGKSHPTQELHTCFRQLTVSLRHRENHNSPKDGQGFLRDGHPRNRRSRRVLGYRSHR